MCNHVAKSSWGQSPRTKESSDEPVLKRHYCELFRVVVSKVVTFENFRASTSAAFLLQEKNDRVCKKCVSVFDFVIAMVT